MELVAFKKFNELTQKMKVCIIIATGLILILVVVALWYFIAVDNIAHSLTVEAGSDVRASDFKLRNVSKDPEFVTDVTAIDTTIPGEYPVKLSYYGRERESVLRVVDTVAPVLSTQDLVLFTTQNPQPEDFILRTQDSTKVFYAYDTKPDMSTPGQQQVRIIAIDLGGNITAVNANLRVLLDQDAPSLSGVTDLKLYLGEELDYLAGVTVSDNLDANASVKVDDSEVDLTKAGEYTLRYIASDTSNNETVKRATLTVIEDIQGPEILGVNKLSMYQGSTISYRNGVIVTDDYAEAPLLTIDSSNVDLTQPGTYNVIYHATDDVGNETVLETTLTVKKQPSSFVEASVVYAKADEILAKIITDDMTTKEKVEAIYKWFRNNCSYVSYSDKTDRIQGAYKMMTKKYGDCFNYYAACSVMLERLDIPQISVERSRDSVRRTKHYWSMVSLDGGQTYYHLDVSPHYTFNHIKTCLVTDATLSRCNRYLPGYYTMDEGVYPATPEEAPE